MRMHQLLLYPVSAIPTPTVDRETQGGRRKTQHNGGPAVPTTNYKNVAQRLRAGVREAHAELFALMLAERAAKVRGRYTDAYDRLEKAMREAEEALKGRD